MNRLFKRYQENTGCLCICLLVIISVTSCINNEDAIQDRLKKYTRSIPVIDTHEHQRAPSYLGQEEYNFYSLLMGSYLNSDLTSATKVAVYPDLLDKFSGHELWGNVSEALNYSAATSYYRHFLSGLKYLYGYDEPVFTEKGAGFLSGEIKSNYKDYGSWFEKAFKRSNFELMFVDRYWSTFDFNIDTVHFALVFNINDLVKSVCYGAIDMQDTTDIPTYYRLAMEEGHFIQSLDDYLLFADELFIKAVKKNVVCLKNSMAYTRPLHFTDVPHEKAIGLFNKGSDLTSDERKQLEDFMFHWVIKKSVKLSLPIQIHTGYLAGNGNWLEHGNPLSLNNLFLQYPEARFVLFHGGYPWSGEIIAFAKMFHNVSLDLVWLAQISKSRAAIAFDEMLDCVPYNKIFWGGDCNLIEESVGALNFGQEIVTEVLAKRIDKGSLNEELAKDIIRKIFRENAINYFDLTNKLHININNSK